MSVKIDLVKGISQSQVQELLIYSKTDSQVIKNTHDTERFKNLESFKAWRPGKTIYILSDERKRLLGIIWFEKKKIPEVPGIHYTFAIRTYRPIRGKGYAEKFMQKAFDDFGRQKGFWLSTRKDNSTAIKLYEKFGFKMVNSKENRIIMVLEG